MVLLTFLLEEGGAADMFVAGGGEASAAGEGEGLAVVMFEVRVEG